MAYRESPKTEVVVDHVFDRTISGQHYTVSARVGVVPTPGRGAPRIGIQLSGSDSEEHPHVAAPLVDAARKGLGAACSRGVLLAYPLVDAEVTLQAITADAHTSPAAVAACCAEAVRKALRTAEVQVRVCVVFLPSVYFEA